MIYDDRKAGDRKSPRCILKPSRNDSNDRSKVDRCDCHSGSACSIATVPTKQVATRIKSLISSMNHHLRPSLFSFLHSLTGPSQPSSGHCLCLNVIARKNDLPCSRLFCSKLLEENRTRFVIDEDFSFRFNIRCNSYDIVAYIHLRFSRFTIMARRT